MRYSALEVGMRATTSRRASGCIQRARKIETDLGGDNNLNMAKFISRTEIFPEYIFDLNPASGLARKHGVAPRWYMWTRSFAPNGAVSAANTQATAVSRMNSGVRYDQQGGKGTVTPGDDTFVSGPNP